MKIHLDLDCYFVSAERKRYPFLKGKNVIVAKGSDKRIFSTEQKQGVLLGDTGAFNSVMEFKNKKRGNVYEAWKEAFLDDDGTIRGIVIAKSYEAKAFGIKTGTPLKQAFQMCKDLVVIPSDHLFYQEVSKELKKYLESQIPVLEQYSIDEFFGDLTGWVKEEDTLEFITSLRDEILEKFDLPITIGASKSKWIAKLLTDKNKPFGVKVLQENEVEAYTKDIPIEEFPGIGRALHEKLSSYRIKTLGQLRQTPALLTSRGKAGRDLYDRICGTDNEEVIPYHDRKGIGIGRNFSAIADRDEIHRRVVILARYISNTIMSLKLNPTTFYFKIRYENGVKSKQSVTEQRLFNERFFIDLAVEQCKKLDIYPQFKIHYISMNASNFADEHHVKTFSLLDYDKDLKMRKLNDELMKMRKKYGVDVIKYGIEK